MGYTELIAEYKYIGYSVDQIGEKCAIIHNDGVESGYTLFDNTVATLAVDHGCSFICQSNMEEMYNETVHKNKPAADYTIYMGVFEEDTEPLEESEYEFK